MSLEFNNLIATQKWAAQEKKPLFRIRVARRSDTEKIIGLLHDLGYPKGASVSTIHWVLSHPEIEVFIASDAQDKPVGLLTLSHRPQLRVDGRIATIDELIVSESWRRRGVARELLRHAIDRARALTARRVEIVTRNGRLAALAFYKACGMVQAAANVFRLQEIDFEQK